MALRKIAWLGLFALVGCTGGGGGDKDGANDTATDEPTDDDNRVPTDTGSFPTAAVQGTIRDTANNPLQVDIRFCREELCLYAETDSSGKYTLDNFKAAPHSFEIVPKDGSLATALIPLEFVEDQVRDIDVAVPAHEGKTNIPSTATEIEVATGLFITVKDGDLAPPNEFLPQPTKVWGALVPTANHPPVDRAGTTHTVLAMWYLDPFDYHAKRGLNFRIRNDLSLPVGETYEVWVGSYDASAWLDVATVTVDAGGFLLPDKKLPLMSTLVLVDPI